MEFGVIILIKEGDVVAVDWLILGEGGVQGVPISEPFAATGFVVLTNIITFVIVAFLGQAQCSGLDNRNGLDDKRSKYEP